MNEMNINYEIQLKQLNLKKKELIQTWLNKNDLHQERMEEKRKQIQNLQKKTN